MTWQVSQTNQFARAYKKLNNSTAAQVDKAIELICNDPSVGEKKKGDLATLRVYKFRHQNQLFLLGYEKDAKIRAIFLVAIGPHENFYRDLKG